MSKTTHGCARRSDKRLYNVWYAMVDRCTNPKNPAFHNYGARGIGVCLRWLSVENFIKDVGLPPSPSHTIGRKDNNEGYSPENFRWETRKEQARNMRTNRLITANGVTLTVAEWSEVGGFKHNTINGRLARGWSEVLAVTAPKRKNQYV